LFQAWQRAASALSLAALAARAHWLTVERLPKYAPELNDIGPIWRDLKAHHLAHQTIAALNAERKPLPLAKPRIFA
jgi:transposase